MKTNKTLSELYSQYGFRARSKLIGIYGDPYARVITLVRRQKKLFAQVVIQHRKHSTIAKANKQEIFPVVHSESMLSLNTAEYSVRDVMP